MSYTGIYYFSLLENDDLARFYENPSEFADRLKENQYLILEKISSNLLIFIRKGTAGLKEFLIQLLRVNFVV